MRTVIAVLSLVFVLANAFAAADSLAGQQIADFTLRDLEGDEISLSDFTHQKVVVVAFVGAECPLVKLYSHRLAELHQSLSGQGVTFLAIDSNQQDSAEDIAEYVQSQRIPFPVLRDPQNKIADRFGATRTPEVFVLDADHAIRYQGRIDDQFEVGLQRAEPSRYDLAIAIEEVLRGRPVEVPETKTPGCIIGRVKTAVTSADVTYSNQVIRILRKNCVECHRAGEIAPFELTDYDEVVGWADTIVEVIDDGRMPPWFASPEHGEFLHDRRMADVEKRLVRQWVENGCPQGEPADLPEEEVFVSDLTREPLDAIYPMGHEAFSVPADGVVDYKYYAIDPGWNEDRWVTRVEAIPGERSVVHHILVFMRRPGMTYAPIYPGELIGGYVPGLQPSDLPSGTAMRIPAGATIVFQMHYTPSGTPQEDLSHVGFRFATPEQVEREASTPRAINVLFQIPPGQSNYEATARCEFREDAELLKMIPHMHLRGKSFRYEARYPNGKREVLLDVPRWDFNWQLEYVLAEPKAMPRGTELICTATYDNSEQNPANPDAEQWVTFGEQTSEEMMIGFFVMTTPRDTKTKSINGSAIPTVRKLVNEFLPQDGEPLDLADRATNITKHGMSLLSRARELGIIKERPLLDEVEPILVAGIEEAKKQDVLSGIGQPGGTDLRRAARFLGNMRGVFSDLSSQESIMTTRVEAVTLPEELPEGQPEELPVP